MGARGDAADSSHKQAGGSVAEFNIVKENVALTVTLAPVDSHARFLQKGEDIFFRIKMRDAISGEPISGLRPAAWVTRRVPNDDAPCSARVANYLGNEALTAEPDLDFTSYYVVSLNADSSLTVLSPHFHSGRSSVLATISLESPGEDWAMTPDQKLLFVSLPRANKVAVIRTDSWNITSKINLNSSPHEVAVQPDGHYVWIGYGVSGDREASGVSIVSSTDARLVTSITTGKGKHDIAFSSDNHFAFVTNEEDGTVSTIDVRQLRKIKDLKTGGKPRSIAFSSMAKLAYVVDSQNGTITVMDGEDQKIVKSIQVEPGLGLISFAPGGRLAFVLNATQNLLHILDASENQIIQTGALQHVPDRIAFSERIAYITHVKSDLITMVPLDRLGVAGAPVPAIDLPAAQNSASLSAHSKGDSVVQAPGEDGVLILDSLGDSIYYYDEGMAAPMGIASNNKHTPQALLVMDAGFRERTPGFYETSARLSGAGDYVLAIFVDSPKIVACFDLVVGEPSEVVKPQ